MKIHNFEEFWKSFLSISPCWRMCCPAGACWGAKGDPENIFPNIEDGRVFWAKRNCATRRCRGEVKNVIFEPEYWENTFKWIWISFYISKPRWNNQNGSGTSILAPDIRHSKNDKNLIMMKTWVIPNRSRITLGVFLYAQESNSPHVAIDDNLDDSCESDHEKSAFWSNTCWKIERCLKLKANHVLMKSYIDSCL